MSIVERLSKVFSNTDNGALLDKYSENIEYVINVFDREKIEVPEIYFLPFWNHVLQLNQRLENGSPIPDDGMDSNPEIAENNVDLANDLIAHFCNNTLRSSKAETMLLSLYLNLFTNGYSQEESSDQHSAAADSEADHEENENE